MARPVVGLLIAGVAVKEGSEAWRGEGCCVSSPLDGAGFAEDCCNEECCAPAELVPTCSLDREGMEAQRDRYAEIGRWFLPSNTHPTRSSSHFRSRSSPP